MVCWTNLFSNGESQGWTRCIPTSKLDTAQEVVLGIKVDCAWLCARITTKKSTRLRSAMRAVLKSGWASGEKLEILIGHATYSGLIDRFLLSVFHATCASIQKDSSVALSSC